MRVFDAIVPLLSPRVEDVGSVIVAGSARIPLGRRYFSRVEPKGARMAFVDGGNGEVVRGPHVSVQLVRVAGVVFDGVERVSRVVRERFVVVQAKSGELFDVVVFDREGNELRRWGASAFDDAFRFANRRAEPATVAQYVRKVLEAELAVELCDGVEVLVRDGDNEGEGRALEKALRELQRVAVEKGVAVVGLSKTSSLWTDSGCGALLALRKIAPEGSWQYCTSYPVGFVKLHPGARYVFRCDVLAGSFAGAVSALAANSVDPAFLGYPFGLLDADKHAQVTRSELAALRVRFAAKTRERFRDVEAAVDAHDILDSL